VALSRSTQGRHGDSSTLDARFAFGHGFDRSRSVAGLPDSMKRWLPFVFLLLLAAATSVHAHAPFPCFFSAAFQQTHQYKETGQ
jgi:hypothetical protein